MLRDRGDTAAASSPGGGDARNASHDDRPASSVQTSLSDGSPTAAAAAVAHAQLERGLAPAPVELQQAPYSTPRSIQEYSSAYSSSYTNAVESPSSQQTHSRQQSFPNLLPLNIRTRLPSPERKQSRPSTSDEMPLTGDGTRGRASESSPMGRIGGFLSGMSGSPARSEGGSPVAHPSPPALSRHATPDTTPTRPKKSQTVVGSMMESPSPRGNSNNNITTSPGQSRFAFFTQTLSRLTQSPTSPVMDEDELLSMNVEAALFPRGPPTERDTFSPSAFKNLQANATGLLLKMQGAYRQRAAALRDVAAEREAQRDELEEAETRAAHLKMQLEGMARKAADHERDMKSLMEDLIAEKRARAEERERMMAREKGLAVTTMLPSEGSTVSEDLGVDEHHQQRRQGWRKSADTMKSDASYDDTDDDSVEVESVFSRSRSPTSAPSAYEGSVVDGPTSRPKAATTTLSPPKARGAQQPMTTFQKLMKNISGEPLREGDEYVGGAGCRNCKGQDASAAWDTVSLLRDENRALKQRVGQLEVAVEGALDMVNGIGM